MLPDIKVSGINTFLILLNLSGLCGVFSNSMPVFFCFRFFENLRQLLSECDDSNCTLQKTGTCTIILLLRASGPSHPCLSLV